MHSLCNRSNVSVLGFIGNTSSKDCSGHIVSFEDQV